MSCKSTTDAIYILRQVKYKALERNSRRYWTFMDLEKAFDHVSRRVVYWSLRKNGISERIILNDHQHNI